MNVLMQYLLEVPSANYILLLFVCIKRDAMNLRALCNGSVSILDKLARLPMLKTYKTFLFDADGLLTLPQVIFRHSLGPSWRN